MKLSEAIRLGAMMKPQAFKAYHSDGACALQAASEACGIVPLAGIHEESPLMIPYPQLRRQFPVLDLDMSCCDKRCFQQWNITDMMSVIWHLNDDHRWTRERIADWVETVENAQEVKQSEPELVATK